MKWKPLAVALAFALWLFLEPTLVTSAELSQGERVETFLQSKNSPLSQHVPVLLAQQNWKLIIAISAIESSYCVHSIGNNCWGIKGDDGYRKYASLDTAIPDVERLIEMRQAQGKWLTVESMNCSYVVPCNPNWVRIVNQTLTKLNSL